MLDTAEIITTLDVAGSRAAAGSPEEETLAAEAKPAGVGSSARRRSWLVRGQDRGRGRKRGVQRRGTRGLTGRPEDIVTRCDVGVVERCRLSTSNRIDVSEQFPSNVLISCLLDSTKQVHTSRQHHVPTYQPKGGEGVSNKIRIKYDTLKH